YAGVDTVVVSGASATPPVTVPVRYVGPCQIGSGCVVTVAPQDTTLSPGGSVVMRISVDSALIPVTGVPVALTNLTPGLILVGPDGSVTALLDATGGQARVEAAIRGTADTLRLNIAPLVAPAAVLVNPGYVTLTSLSPGNTAQLTATVTDIAGKPLPPSLATWTSRTPAVATVSSTGLVTAGAPGSAIVVATAAPGVADSLVVMVGDGVTPPGNAIGLPLIGGRSFGVTKLGQPLAIDVVVDLKAVPIELLGTYDARFTWNAGVLRFDSTQAGTFASPVVIPDTARWHPALQCDRSDREGWVSDAGPRLVHCDRPRAIRSRAIADHHDGSSHGRRSVAWSSGGTGRRHRRTVARREACYTRNPRTSARSRSAASSRLLAEAAISWVDAPCCSAAAVACSALAACAVARVATCSACPCSRAVVSRFACAVARTRAAACSTSSIAVAISARPCAAPSATDSIPRTFA